jgi:hypothetical protein
MEPTTFLLEMMEIPNTAWRNPSQIATPLPVLLYPLVFKPDATIGDVKEKIATAHRTAHSYISPRCSVANSMLFNGKPAKLKGKDRVFIDQWVDENELKNDRTLYDYNIDAESSLYFFFLPSLCY